MAEGAITMQTLITDIGTFFTGAVGWMGEALESVTGSPALTLLVIAIPVAGVGIGYLKRLISL